MGEARVVVARGLMLKVLLEIEVGELVIASRNPRGLVRKGAGAGLMVEVE